MILSHARVLLIRRVGPREIPRCEWVTPLPRPPWIERCPEIGALTEHFQDATIRLCATHKERSRESA
jgi:hypothetical protein